MVITGVCSLGLATLAIAEDTSSFNNKNFNNKKINSPKSENYTENYIVFDAGIPETRFNPAAVLTRENSLEIDRRIPRRDDSNGKRLPVIATSYISTTPSHAQPQPIPKKAIELIKEFEGFAEFAYIDTDGTPVIGYGLSRIKGKSVKMGDRISATQADVALKEELRKIQQQLKSKVTVELNDSQLSALASLSFNTGVNSIAESTLLRKLNAGDYNGAANEFLRWDKANVRGKLVRLPGLTRRRQAERQLFLDKSS